MKKSFLLVMLIALWGCSSHAQVEWQTIENASQIEISNNKKLFFVDFSTSWCGWCKKMDRETFNDPVIVAILNKYYIPIHFDAEGKAEFIWDGQNYAGAKVGANGRPATHPFTHAVLGQKIGYPSFALFSKDRKLIQILQGYQSAYDFQMILWYFANGDTERYSFEQYQQVFNEKIKPDMMKKLGLDK